MRTMTMRMKTKMMMMIRWNFPNVGYSLHDDILSLSLFPARNNTHTDADADADARCRPPERRQTQTDADADLKRHAVVKTRQPTLSPPTSCLLACLLACLHRTMLPPLPRPSLFHANTMHGEKKKEKDQNRLSVKNRNEEKRTRRCRPEYARMHA